MDDSRRRFLSLATAAAVGLGGCVGSPENPESRGGSGGSPPSEATDTPTTRDSSTPEAPSEAEPRTDVSGLVRGQASFGLDLLANLASRRPGRNQFVSPYSLEVALAMTYAGAAGRTRTQMAETLAFQPRDSGLHPAFQALRRRLGVAGSETPTPSPTPTEADSMQTRAETTTPFTFVGANALWGQQGFPWRDAFLRTLERYYGAGLRTVDFKAHHGRARRRINDWVAARTRDTIPSLFPEGSLSRRTRLVLANAVYFRANWAEAFPAEKTEPRPFTALDGTTTPVPTMTREDEVMQYASVDGHQLVELPYAGGEFGMVVVMPAEGTFARFTRTLTADRLLGLFDRLDDRTGTLRLPKFAFGSDLGLGDALSALGMPIAFRSDANFDPMGAGPAGQGLALDSVRHETYVSVDEHGTVASAATGVEVALVSGHISEDPFEMTVDRPFLFVIRHRPTDLPVFVGRVADASAARPSG